MGRGFARSREVVIEHGGQIWAESRRGTCFVIYSAEAARALSVSAVFVSNFN
jgi:signal transduction histidine kinase